MPTTTVEDRAERVVRKRWTDLGVADNVQDDLVGLAHELQTVSGRDFADCLARIEQRAQEWMEARIMGRVHDTMLYQGDLDK